MSNVLTPLTLEELHGFFDETALATIEFFLKKSLVSQPEKLPTQEELPIQIPKEHIEQWIVQALGTRSLGAGSYPVDVVHTSWAADVKMLSCKMTKKGNLKNADSGETSLAQKFNDNNFGGEKTLDDLFSQKEYEFIWTKWKEILVSKYKQVEDDHDITDIFYFIMLRAGKTFYLCGLKVDLLMLDDTSINYTRSTDSSIWIQEFIDDAFGHIKIYKSKKRLELRLKPKKWVDSNMVIPFDTGFEQISTNIREKVINQELEQYIKDTLIPIFK